MKTFLSKSLVVGMFLLTALTMPGTGSAAQEVHLGPPPLPTPHALVEAQSTLSNIHFSFDRGKPNEPVKIDFFADNAPENSTFNLIIVNADGSKFANWDHQPLQNGRNSVDWTPGDLHAGKYAIAVSRSNAHSSESQELLILTFEVK